MRSMSKILWVVVLSMGITAMPDPAAGSGAEAFEKLKSLVGHWETDKTNMNKATLDLEVTSGGTALLERFQPQPGLGRRFADGAGRAGGEQFANPGTDGHGKSPVRGSDDAAAMKEISFE